MIHSDPAWKNRVRPEEGVLVLDLTRALDTDPKERERQARYLLRALLHLLVVCCYVITDSPRPSLDFGVCQG
jgi:hypothetical protein